MEAQIEKITHLKDKNVLKVKNKEKKKFHLFIPFIVSLCLLAGHYVYQEKRFESKYQEYLLQEEKSNAEEKIIKKHIASQNVMSKTYGADMNKYIKTLPIYHQPLAQFWAIAPLGYKIINSVKIVDGEISLLTKEETKHLNEQIEIIKSDVSSLITNNMSNEYEDELIQNKMFESNYDYFGNTPLTKTEKFFLHNDYIDPFNKNAQSEFKLYEFWTDRYNHYSANHQYLVVLKIQQYQDIYNHKDYEKYQQALLKQAKILGTEQEISQNFLEKEFNKKYKNNPEHKDYFTYFYGNDLSPEFKDLFLKNPDLFRKYIKNSPQGFKKDLLHILDNGIVRK